ncbi:CELL DIVISION PROTEIN FTSZ-RELATED [Salix koriyanagi]|uniref:CELL DIVISION PROTEIN FTSZ-RELATED n=1 Tax=Salix koriyanagi TaxID=2511006 RepID=A0A9Q0TSW3_9ROSI|nr:CELL DIVISION PROTEIN FTSZ-RELATED [Salix koriyanagi]
MLRSDANDTYSSLIKETSGGNVTESSGDSSFTSNYNEAKIKAMKMSPVLPENRLQVGKELTRGLGAGGNPDVGMNAANESKAAIEEALYGADMVFITVCLCSFSYMLLASKKLKRMQIDPEI